MAVLVVVVIVSGTELVDTKGVVGVVSELRV